MKEVRRKFLIGHEFGLLLSWRIRTRALILLTRGRYTLDGIGMHSTQLTYPLPPRQMMPRWIYLCGILEVMHLAWKMQEGRSEMDFTNIGCNESLWRRQLGLPPNSMRTQLSESVTWKHYWIALSNVAICLGGNGMTEAACYFFDGRKFGERRPVMAHELFISRTSPHAFHSPRFLLRRIGYSKSWLRNSSSW